MKEACYNFFCAVILLVLTYVFGTFVFGFLPRSMLRFILWEGAVMLACITVIWLIEKLFGKKEIV